MFDRFIDRLRTLNLARAKRLHLAAQGRSVVSIAMALDRHNVQDCYTGRIGHIICLAAGQLMNGNDHEFKRLIATASRMLGP